MDLIFDFLTNEYYAEKKYFDFGMSTEKKGHLNAGLITQKEVLAQEWWFMISSNWRGNEG